jgi:hypothetical protein
MRTRRRLDLPLLLLAGSALFFGGGLGCDPVLEGVDFRATSRLSDPTDRTSPRDWYMAFNGKKAPGNGYAALPHPLLAPFAIEARMGVFDASRAAASQGSEGCIGMRNIGAAEEYRLCVRQDPGAMVIESSLDDETADCPPPASALETNRVRLELADDGMGEVVARYRCPGLPEVELTSAASLWSDTEEWHAFVSANGLAKGGQVAFDDFLVASGEVGIGDPGEFAFQTFEAFRLGLEAFYAIEDEDPSLGGARAGEAHGRLLFAAEATADLVAAKLLSKAASSAGKLLLSSEKYQKGFAKLAGVEADALEAGP